MGIPEVVIKTDHKLAHICDVLVYDYFENERGISNPSEQIVRINCVRRGYYNSCLWNKKVKSFCLQSNLMGEGKQTFAPEDFEPDEPMFANKPAFAIGDSLSIYESTVVD